MVVRADLPPGLQIAQAIHAARQFAEVYRSEERAWYRRSNTVAVLAVSNERALDRLAGRAEREGISCVVFREPDLGKAGTALSLGSAGKKLCRGLPLALKG